ncbi:MAG: recombination regulator RecX [Gemmatimonadetes bacterium]|nr:recombination regulator RecX [Gemmatimonadota bacterium]
MAVVLDDGRELVVSARLTVEFGLRTGDPLDPRDEARLVEADAAVRAREAALSLLSFRPRSRRELADRLRRKGFEARIVDATLEDLSERGWVDDAAFARAVVRDRLRLRPRGPGRMAQELRHLGVGDRDAREAVEQVFEEEEVSVPALALDLARGWLRRQSPAVGAALMADEFTPEREKARRRLHAFLARRGFAGGAARSALEGLLADPPPSRGRS